MFDVKSLTAQERRSFVEKYSERHDESAEVISRIDFSLGNYKTDV